MRNPEFTTLSELLAVRAGTAPDQVAYTFLQDGITPSDRLTYGELARRARKVAARLRETSVPGDRALLLFPPGLDFVVALFACFEAGVTTVPAYPPGRRGYLHLEPIFGDARPAAVLTTRTISDGLPDGVRQVLGTRHGRAGQDGDIVCLPTLFAGTDGPVSDPLALLQYTSGSTSTPKGVMVGNDNLLANSRIIRDAFDLSPDSVSVSWLPAYHDMGLIDGILQPIHTGFPAYLMPPTVFLKSPMRWLQAVSLYRATHSGGPDFAYTLCVERTDAAQRHELDLSSWLSAYNGAEPIRPGTLTAFTDAFEPHGFRPQALYPCYGLAEGTLMVTGAGIGAGARVLELSADELSANGTARPAEPGVPAVHLVSSGRVLGGAQLSVVDPETRLECTPGRVGEVWLSGDSVAAGYWNSPDGTEETFEGHLADSGDGPYLRTGDTGFLDGGELFVTGRLKDLIIIRGRNYYPQDLERTVDDCDPATRSGCAAAFTIPGEDADRLVVVCEVTTQAAEGLDGDGLVRTIRRSIQQEHGVQVGAVCLLPPGSIPKTSSGKIRRRESRARYLDGTLGELFHRVATRETWSGPPTAAVRPPPARSEQDREAWLTAYVTETVGDRAAAASGASSSAVLLDPGIDSLAAAETAHRMSSELGVPVAMTDFLENSTVEQVVRRLVDLLDAESSTPTGPGPADPGAGPDRQLSAGEEALWFLHTADPASAAYNTGYAARLPREVDLGVLSAAVSSLSARHPALRTTFDTVDGRPRAMVHDDMPVPVTRDGADPSGAVSHQQRIAEFRDRTFDLQNGPLIRALIIDDDPDQRILVLAAHHIVVDLWSLRILVDDLRQAYAGREPETGGAAEDHSRHVADPLPGAETERLWRYWSGRLAGVPTVFELPYDRPRPVVRGDAGGAVSMRLDDELAAELTRFARASGVTVYTLLLAAYQVLLHRHTGSTDFVIGSPVAARTRPELASVVGYRANQLVLRARLADDPSFAEHLGRVRETVLGALSHQELPFSRLVERLRPLRDPSWTPVFQVMFAYEKMPPTDAVELSWDQVEIDTRAVRFDLTLACVEQDGSLTTRWEYSSELFDRGTVEQLGLRFRSLLADLVRRPERSVGSVPIVDDAERRRAVRDWNATATAVRQESLHRLIADHAVSTPGAVAVRYGTTELTYGELDRRARALADRLGRHGVAPGSLVPVCLPRSPDLVVALLAVLYRGGAFVSLDPAHPERRITHVLEDTGASVVLTRADLRDRIPGTVVTVHVEDAAPGDPTPSGAVTDVAPGARAYVLYTSGSTGAPKGVMVSHRSIVNYLTWAVEEYRIADGAGAPVSSSVTFDATMTSLFGPLVAGRTVTLLSQQDEIGELRDVLLREPRQSLVKATPSQLDLLRAVLPGDATPLNAGVLVVGGEAFPPESLEFWRRQSPGMRIVNEYGPTEATVGCSVHEATAFPPDPRGVPIGRPIANAEMYVLDSSQDITPPGVPGEIYIGGVGLADGYLNLPGLTAERFVPHPFREDPGARVYRTGDRARYRPDGVIEYLGREDEQVKIRGVRVELGEIESLMLEHHGVQEAAVTVSSGASVDRRLTAHVVADTGIGNGLERQLCEFLADRLPGYMVPTDVLVHEELPRTPHGKIDRAPLRRAAGRVRSGPAAAPAHPELEGIVAAIWRDVLPAGEVDTTDNFFDLGGTSAAAAEIRFRLSNELDREVSMVTLFRYPTVESLARSLAGAPDGPGTRDAAAERAANRARALNRRSRG